MQCFSRPQKHADLVTNLVNCNFLKERSRNKADSGGVHGGHADQFRDTFAVSLVDSSRDSSSDITKKHSAPWVVAEPASERVPLAWKSRRIGHFPQAVRLIF
jgi:hypothetical protein